MSEPERERPALELDDEVAGWLLFQAQRYFHGDVGKALNYHLRQVMERHTYWGAKGLLKGPELPDSPWDRLEANLPPQ